MANAFEVAATAGDTQAMFRLGKMCYVRGMNSGRNLQERKQQLEDARRWLRGAARSGDDQALLYLGRVLKQLGKSQRAEEVLLQSVEAGNSQAMIELADMSRIQGDESSQRKWLTSAVAAGDGEGMVLLGLLMRRDGELERAKKLFAMAVSAGCNDGLRELCLLAREQKDHKAAKAWSARCKAVKVDLPGRFENQIGWSILVAIAFFGLAVVIGLPVFIVVHFGIGSVVNFFLYAFLIALLSILMACFARSLFFGLAFFAIVFSVGIGTGLVFSSSPLEHQPTYYEKCFDKYQSEPVFAGSLHELCSEGLLPVE